MVVLYGNFLPHFTVTGLSQDPVCTSECLILIEPVCNDLSSEGFRSFDSSNWGKTLCSFPLCFLKLTLQFPSNSHWSHLIVSESSLLANDMFFLSRNFYFLAAFLWSVKEDFFFTSVLDFGSFLFRVLKLNVKLLESLTSSLKVFWLESIFLDNSRY